MDIHQKCDAHLVDRLRPISKDHLKDINKYDRVSVLKQPAIHNLLEVLVSYGDSNRCEEPHTIHTPDKARIGTASWSRSLSIGKSGMSCIFNFGSISLLLGSRRKSQSRIGPVVNEDSAVPALQAKNK